jgi:hypothetical protein
MRPDGSFPPHISRAGAVRSNARAELLCLNPAQKQSAIVGRKGYEKDSRLLWPWLEPRAFGKSTSAP